MKAKGTKQKARCSLLNPRANSAGNSVWWDRGGNSLPTWTYGDEIPLTKPSICTCFTAESPEPPLPLPFPTAPEVELEEAAVEPEPSLRDAIFQARQEERET